MQRASILVRLEMENFKIWTVAHLHTPLLALIVVVLIPAGPCNGSDDSTKTVSVIDSVAFDCNACSEQNPAFSGADVVIKYHRGNDVSANGAGAGSMNDDGSFVVHLDKVELGDPCLAAVVMSNKKLCSLAKTCTPTSMEKLSVSTPLVWNLLKPKYPFKLHFFKPKPLSKFPPLFPISKPKPFVKTKVFKPKHLLKPQPTVILVKPKSFLKLPPLPSILKPKEILKPKFFTPPFPTLKFPHFPKLKLPHFPSPRPLPKLLPEQLPPKPKFFKPPFPKSKLAPSPSQDP